MASVGQPWIVRKNQTDPSEIDSLHGQLAALQQALTSTRTDLKQERDRSAATIRATEKRYRALFDNVPTGLYRLSADGTVELANPAFLQMLGYSSLQEINGLRLTPPEEIFAPGCSGRVEGCERKLARADGSYIFVRESGHAVPGPRGTMAAYEGVVQDITPERRARRFEQGCRDLLERVARNESLRDILRRLADLIESQVPGSSCAILLNSDGLLHQAAGTELPADCRRKIGDHLPGNGLMPVTSVCSSGLTTTAHPILSGRGQVLGSVVLWGPEAPGNYMLQTACGIASMAIEHSRLCDSLVQQASHDALTGLPNRNSLEQRLSVLIQSCDSVALCWLDLDDFKQINDSLGHAFGDELIRQVSRRLVKHTPAEAMVARMGADEFAVALPQVDVDHAAAAAAHLLAALNGPFHLNGFELFVTATAGIAVYPDHGLSGPELEQNADAAMHHAKSAGRTGCVIYQDEISAAIRERMDIAHGLRRALDRNELRLEYQPQVDLSGQIEGFEALLRWQHPTRGLLSPGQFIAIAEEAGLIVPIGSWVIEEACRQAAIWNQASTVPLRVAVNVSSLQFYFSDLTEVVRAALVLTGLPPECLELELTESTLVQDRANCATDLRELRALGITIAIDDFGTGFSCLSYLRQLPVDVLKIDRSFLLDLDSTSGPAVLKSIAALAHSLDLRVVAEGIEDTFQLEMVRGLGIDLAQGYLVGRPQRPEWVRQWIESGRPADPALARSDEPGKMAAVL